jgi:hypothetical protein
MREVKIKKKKKKFFFFFLLLLFSKTISSYEYPSVGIPCESFGRVFDGGCQAGGHWREKRGGCGLTPSDYDHSNTPFQKHSKNIEKR